MAEQQKAQQGKDVRTVAGTSTTPDEKENFRYFVRIANTDLDGNKYISDALRKIKGVNFMFSNMVCNLAGLAKSAKTGNLKEEEIKRIDDVLNNPLKYNVPPWMLNRRKDYEDGRDFHAITSNLTFIEENDIKKMKKMRSYKGVRHGLGLPVRGQRTKSNFRKNKGKVSLGVKKRADAKPGKV